MSEAAAAAGFSRLLSDERLTRRAVGGDERAFAAIFRRYHQSLYRFILAIVGNPEDAQDALQNTMMKVLRALPGEERRIELKPWLYRIAHNESIDLLRRRRETRELDAEAPAPGGLAEDAATRERLRRLLTDLRELPERQREVLVMRELAGLDFEEIGTALDTSGAVARQTLYEARQSLRQMEEGREMSCADVTKALSDGDGRVTRRRDVRAHLRSCAGCRSFREEIKSRQHDLAALSPLPAVAAAGMLHGLIGGTQAATGGGLAAVLGGGAAKTIGAGAAAKGVATVAVVAAVGVTAADRSGMIDVGLPGGSGGKSSDATPGAGQGHSQSGVGNGVPAGDGGKGAGAATGVQGEDGREKADEGAENGVSPQSGAPGKGQAKGHEEGRRNGKPHTDAKPQPGAQGPPLEHPTGRNEEKEKQTPEAAAGGQETAEANKPPPREEGDTGKDKEGGRPATPPKPSPDSPKGAPSDSPKSAPPSSPPSSPPSQGAPPKAPPANPPASPPSPSPQPQPQPKGPPEAAPESSGGSGGPGNSGGHGKPAEPGNSGGKKP